MKRSWPTLLFLLLYCSHAHAKDVIFETIERFHPIQASSHMVATQEDHATQIGQQILANGGNAIDAAVAIGFALAVTLPRAGNLGGGGFMLLWLNKKHTAVALDYREVAPQGIDVKMFLDENGEPIPEKIHRSYLASGVPGTVDGLLTAHEKWGHLPLMMLMRPAIDLAHFGFIVTPGLADALKQHEVELKKDPETAKTFFKQDGSSYQVGDRIKQRDLAKTLRLIAREGKKAFYQGPIAKQIIDATHAHGGVMTLTDLKNYQTKIREPIIGSYRGKTIYSMPLPSSGGLTLIETLNVLDKVNIEEIKPNSASYFHVLTEVMNLTYNDRNTELGDSDFVNVPTHRLLSDQHAEHLAGLVKFEKHTPSRDIAKIAVPQHESEETTHYSVVDKEGNMVANTYTLNFSFGNGHVVPGAGFLMNNELDDFTLKAGRPNGFDLIQGNKNLLSPGRRPLSSMTPTIVINENGTPMMALGSPGGSRIITTVLQVLLHAIDEELNIATSVAMPRIHSQLWPDVLYVEQGISLDTLERLREMGHHIEQSPAMGSVQVVAMRGKHIEGYADPRRMGASASGQ